MVFSLKIKVHLLIMDMGCIFWLQSLLGEYVEELHIPIDYWGIEEYKNSWATSIADGIEKKQHSVLITSMHEPESLNFISTWIIYYDGEISYKSAFTYQ